MEQAKKEMLAAAGIDAEDALERFMGSEALLTRFLGCFLEDASMDALRGAVAAGDWDKALTASDTLKGTCGSLAMTVLYDLFTRQVALLRASDTAGAAALRPAIEAACRKAAAAIRELWRWPGIKRGAGCPCGKSCAITWWPRRCWWRRGWAYVCFCGGSCW